MSEENISFEQIPGSTLDPGVYFEFNTRLAVRNLPGNPYILRLIGQSLVNAPLAALTPVKFFSDEEAASLFGYGSQLHRLAMASLKANNYVQICAIPLADAAGSTAAQGSITFSNAATKGGSLVLAVANEEVRIAVDAGDDAAAVAAALKDAIEQEPQLPVNATVEGAVVTLKAKNKGLVGNDVSLAMTLEGVTGTTAVLVPMAGGLGNPDVGPALASIQESGDNLLVMPYLDTTNLTKLRDHLDLVGNGLEQRGAIGVVASTDSYGSVVSLASGINHWRVTLGWLNGSATPAMEVAAAYAAVLAFEEDPARPLNGLELKGVAPPPIEKRASRPQREACLHNGITPLRVGPGEKVQIVRAISTYTLNAQGINDPAGLDITTPRTLDYVRFSIRQRLALRFPRDKRTQGKLKKIRSEILDVLYKLEELEIVENVAALASGVIVKYSAHGDGRVDIRIPVDVVNGLHVIAGVIDLIL